jgi:hypothetical protein
MGCRKAAIIRAIPHTEGASRRGDSAAIIRAIPHTEGGEGRTPGGPGSGLRRGRKRFLCQLPL